MAEMTVAWLVDQKELRRVDRKEHTASLKADQLAAK